MIHKDIVHYTLLPYNKRKTAKMYHISNARHKGRERKGPPARRGFSERKKKKKSNANKKSAHYQQVTKNNGKAFAVLTGK